MARQQRTITLHQGLTTSFDDLDAPLGSLAIARNVRYFPHKRSFSLALGRRYIDDAIPGNAVRGTFSFDPITAVRGVAWDEGAGTIRHMALYLQRFGLVTISMPDFVETPIQIRESLNAPIGLETGTAFDIVAFENEFYVATSRSPLWLRRVKAGAPTEEDELQGWGMDELLPGKAGDNASLLPVLAITADGTGATFEKGSYWYWLTWVSLDETKGQERDVEGTHNGWELSDASQLHQQGADSISVDGLMRNIEVHLLVSALSPELIPPHATHIRIYRGVTASINPKLHGVPPPWPIGSRVATVSLASIFASPIVRIGVFNSGTPDHGIIKDFYKVFTDVYALKRDQTEKPFDFISVRLDTLSAETGMNGKPPRADALEVFEESIISNDLDDQRKTRFSFPGKPHAFPSIYFINHESKESDKVLAYKTLKGALGVFLRYGIDRVNWLPRQSDADFNRGRIKVELTRSRGLASRLGITKFQHPQLGEMIAYVSDDGIYITDLRQIRLWTSHLDWVAHVQNPESTLLIDDPDNWRLILAHQSPGDQTRQRLTYLYYDGAHVTQDGRPAIVGPIDRIGGVASLTLVRKANGARQVMSGDDRGDLLYEDIGSEEQATQHQDGGEATPLVMQLQTPEIYPKGLLNETSIERFGFKGSGVAKYTGSILLPNSDGITTRRVDLALDFTTVKLNTKAIIESSERLAFEVTGDSSAIEISHLAMIGDDAMGEIER